MDVLPERNTRHAGAVSSRCTTTSAISAAPPQANRNHSKARTGCQQCKKRRVKCDEKQPSCTRCVARGETCTGNFRWDQWQIERPWVSSKPTLVSGRALEDETLRYWYDKACLVMAMQSPPANPLSYPLATLIRGSAALRHAVQSVADGHRAKFEADKLAHALNERNLAIVALRGEVEAMQSALGRQSLIRTILLASLILCISSNWLDSATKDFGLEFLLGAKSMIKMLPQDSTDNFTFYALGMFSYCEAFWSYLVPASQQRMVDYSLLQGFSSPPFADMVHPVTGVATTLCPILAEIGQFYRRVVEANYCDVDFEEYLKSRLAGWRCPHSDDALEVTRLAEGYRNLGFVLLHQAHSVVHPMSLMEILSLQECVSEVMRVLRLVPRNPAALTYVGPLLLIAGSEVDNAEQRMFVEELCEDVIKQTRIPVHHRSLDLVRRVWSLRDSGSRATWLELMVHSGICLAVG